MCSGCGWEMRRCACEGFSGEGMDSAEGRISSWRWGNLGGGMWRGEWLRR